MNKLLFAGVFALGGAAALAVPAFAQGTDQVQPNTPVAAQAENHAQPAPQRSVPPLDSRQCIRDTGSHIPPKKGQCLPVAGSSYSQKDIQRTGATNIGQALQMLDPSVTVHGH